MRLRIVRHGIAEPRCAPGDAPVRWVLKRPGACGAHEFLIPPGPLRRLAKRKT